MKKSTIILGAILAFSALVATSSTFAETSTAYTTTKVNFRQSPSTYGSVITTIPLMEKIEVDWGKQDGEFTSVKYQNQSGWLVTKFITKEFINIENFIEPFEPTDSGVRIRKDKSDTAEILDNIETGQTVLVDDNKSNSDWKYVYYEQKATIGYVMTKLLKPSKPIELLALEGFLYSPKESDNGNKSKITEINLKSGASTALPFEGVEGITVSPSGNKILYLVPATSKDAKCVIDNFPDYKILDELLGCDAEFMLYDKVTKTSKTLNLAIQAFPHTEGWLTYFEDGVIRFLSEDEFISIKSYRNGDYSPDNKEYFRYNLQTSQITSTDEKQLLKNSYDGKEFTIGKKKVFYSQKSLSEVKSVDEIYYTNQSGDKIKLLNGNRILSDSTRKNIIYLLGNRTEQISCDSSSGWICEYNPLPQIFLYVFDTEKEQLFSTTTKIDFKDYTVIGNDITISVSSLAEANITPTIKRPKGTVPSEKLSIGNNNIVNSVSLPSDLSFKQETISRNIFLVILFLLVFGVSSNVFNSTIKDEKNKEILKKFFARFPFYKPSRNLAERKRFPLIEATFYVILLSLINSFIDPSFNPLRMNTYSVTILIFISSVIGVVVGSTALGISYKRLQLNYGYKVYLLGLFLAVVCVGISRFYGVTPGFLFGVPGFIVLLSEKVSTEHSGKANTLSSLIIFIFALLCWVLAGFLNDSRTIQGILLGLFVASIEGLFFSLIPLAYTDGEAIYNWNKKIWGGLFGSITLVFIYTFFLPTGSFSSLLSSPVFSLSATVLSLYAGMSLLVWFYFKNYDKTPALFSSTGVVATATGLHPKNDDTSKDFITSSTETYTNKVLKKERNNKSPKEKKPFIVWVKEFIFSTWNKNIEEIRMRKANLFWLVRERIFQKNILEILIAVLVAVGSIFLGLNLGLVGIVPTILIGLPLLVLMLFLFSFIFTITRVSHIIPQLSLVELVKGSLASNITSVASTDTSVDGIIGDNLIGLHEDLMAYFEEKIDANNIYLSRIVIFIKSNFETLNRINQYYLRKIFVIALSVIIPDVDNNSFLYNLFFLLQLKLKSFFLFLLYLPFKIISFFAKQLSFACMGCFVFIGIGIPIFLSSFIIHNETLRNILIIVYSLALIVGIGRFLVNKFGNTTVEAIRVVIDNLPFVCVIIIVTLSFFLGDWGKIILIPITAIYIPSMIAYFSEGIIGVNKNNIVGLFILTFVLFIPLVVTVLLVNTNPLLSFIYLAYIIMCFVILLYSINLDSKEITTTFNQLLQGNYKTFKENLFKEKHLPNNSIAIQWEYNQHSSKGGFFCE